MSSKGNLLILHRYLYIDVHSNNLVLIAIGIHLWLVTIPFVFLNIYLNYYKIYEIG